MKHETPIDRGLPVAIEVERAILGAIVLDSRNPNECLLQAQQSIKADDFGLDTHQRIFRAMEELARTRKPIEYTTLFELLQTRREVDVCGGIAYITDLIDPAKVIRLKNIEHYCELLLKASSQRQLIHATYSAMQQAYESGQPAEIIGYLQERMDLITDRSQSRTCQHVSAIVPGVIKNLQKQWGEFRDYIGLPTGIGRLNSFLGGLVRGENIVLAGDTGAGKTAFALNITETNCLKDTPVQYFSLELAREDLLIRLAARRSGVPQFKIRNTSKMRSDEMGAILAQLMEIEKWPLWIDDSGNLNVRELYARGRMQAARGARLLIVDYLQKVKAPGYTLREQINNASECVRAMAKDCKIPALNLSQLSRPDKSQRAYLLRKPTMHDLKESGNIEQDAHSVLLLWREHREEEGKIVPTGNDAIIVGKNRNGPCGEIAARYSGPLMHWTEAEF